MPVSFWLGSHPQSLKTAPARKWEQKKIAASQEGIFFKISFKWKHRSSWIRASQWGKPVTSDKGVPSREQNWGLTENLLHTWVFFEDSPLQHLVRLWTLTIFSFFFQIDFQIPTSLLYTRYVGKGLRERNRYFIFQLAGHWTMQLLPDLYRTAYYLQIMHSELLELWLFFPLE